MEPSRSWSFSYRPASVTPVPQAGPSIQPSDSPGAKSCSVSFADWLPGNSEEHFSSPQAIPLFLPNDEEPPDDSEEPLPLVPLNNILVVEDMPERVAIPKPVSPDIDPIDAYIARVLEIIPDVQPAHVHTLITQRINTYKDGSVEQVLHTLFDDTNYPKIDKKGKRKREEVDNEGGERGLTKIKIDYGDKDRVHSYGRSYVNIALVWSTPGCNPRYLLTLFRNNYSLISPTSPNPMCAKFYLTTTRSMCRPIFS